MPVTRTEQSPLAGLRVLDLGGHIAGPLAAMLLADQGADVVHVDAPGQANAANLPLDALLQRNKRRTVIDLRTAEGKSRAFDLIRAADVVIENLGPGTVGRLGVGFEECRKVNPRLVYLSLPAFASGDPELAHVKGWESLIGAVTGLFTNISFVRDFLGLPPVYTALKLPSVYAAVHGATAVMMSLVRRRPTGEHIEVPLAGAMMSAMGATALSYAEQPERYDLPPVSRAFKATQLPVLKQKFAPGGVAEVGQALGMAAALPPPMMASYPCADGRLVYVFAMDHVRMSRVLLTQLGIIDRFDGRLVDRDPYEPSSVNNNLNDVGTLSKELKDEIRAAMSQAFRTRPAADWERLLSAAGVPCAVVRSTAEWMQEPHVRESGIAVGINDVAAGEMLQPGPSVWLEGASDGLRRPRSRQAPAEARGIEWMPRENNWTPNASANESAECLSGIRVIDLSTMIAGPACARTLAEYGAEVIKVDPVKPYLGPRMSIWYSPELNQGKTSVLIDLKSPDGREAFLKLVETADVLVHNMRPGVLEQLRITPEELKRRQPRLVVTSITAYSGPAPGPWSAWPGYDPVVQAASGVAARYGSAESPEIHAVASTIDYLTGYLAAFGTAMALGSHGKFTRVNTSLAQASTLAQLPYTVVTPRKVWPEAAGQLAVGEGPGSQIHRTSDGWVFLHAPTALAWSRFEANVRQSARSNAASSDASATADWVRASTSGQVLEAASRSGVAGVRIQTLEEVLRTRTFARTQAGFNEARKHSFAALLDEDHPLGTSVRTIAPLYARLRHRPLQLGTPSERHGASTRRHLQETGIAGAAVDRLVSQGAAADRLSAVFLPG